ncbi:MAG: radical SAM protein [Spirochaetales bacterium]|nr:radical SAM protein [Spirochaetales bacterium]
MVNCSFSIDMSKAIMPLLFDDNKEIAQKTLNILKKDPLFVFEKRDSFNNSNRISGGFYNECSYFNKIFNPERIESLSKSLKNIPAQRFKKYMHQLAELPGVDFLDHKLIFSGDKSSIYTEFKKLRRSVTAKNYPKQGFISPSYRCNLDCAYCFSKDMLKKFNEDMTIENYKLYIKKLKKDFDVQEIGFFGGEPTYFPKLIEFIEEAENEALYCNLASNGIIDSKTWGDIVARNSIRMITLHIEDDDFYREKKIIETLLSNISSALKLGRQIIFRFNISKENIDWNFLKKYIDLVPKFRFSFALPFPSVRGDNTFIELNDMGKYGATIISMIDYISHNCSNYEIVLAKPIPLCVFTEYEYDQILNNIKYKNICEIDKNNNTNNLMINPDGSYQPCVALNSDKFIYNDFLKTESLSSNYHLNINRVLKTPIMEKCNLCYLFTIGACQGACYAYGA